MLALLSLAHAATLTVDAAGGADFTTINDAIDASSSGDTISVAPGTYAEAINYDGKTLAIESTGGSGVTVLDAGASASWAVRIRSGEGEGTSLVGFTVRNEGYSGAWLSGATVLFEDVVFEDLGYTGATENASLDSGGAVRIVSGTYTFSGVRFEDSLAKDSGGALYIDDGEVTITGSEIDDSSAGGVGGAIYIDGGTLTITGSALTNNGSAGDGGAIYIAGATLVATDTEFLNNQTTDSPSDGGALYISDADITLAGLTVEDNAARLGSGGALLIEGATTLLLSDSTFARNTAERNGGHIALTSLSESIQIDTTYFSSGRASASGGGLYGLGNASLTLTDVSLTNNKAALHGGGIYLVANSTLDCSGCSFSGNIAEEGSGGGLYVLEGSTDRRIELSGSAFTGNEAKYQGGGLSVDAIGQLALSQVTFTGNSGLFDGTLGGGLYVSDVSAVTVHQCQFSGNAATIGAGAYAYGSPGVWTNTLFWENAAEVAGGLSLSGSEYTLVNNTFAGNIASREAAGLALYGVVGGISNTIFSHHDGSAVYVYDAASASGVALSYNDWYGNTTDLAGESLSLSSTALSVDPRYAAWPPQSMVGTISFVLAPDSALVDAGDPALLDPDDTTSDVGAWGGPGLIVTDDDGDGYDSSRDYDDDDSSIHPGAEEVWYDGTSSDCVPDDDFDADGDGAAAAAYGGEDCDDADPAITTDCAEGGGGQGCGGCGSAGGAGGLSLWLLLLVTSRVRRTSSARR